MQAQVHVQTQMQMQKRCRWSVDCPGLLLTEPEDDRQHFYCPFSRQSQDIKQVMPCMQIVFSNSKSGGWISMDPSRSWPCQSVSFPFGIAASPWGGVPFSGAHTRYCGSTDRRRMGGAARRARRKQPWNAWPAQLPWVPLGRLGVAEVGSHRRCHLGRTQDVSSCRRGGPGRPAKAPSGELGCPCVHGDGMC